MNKQLKAWRLKNQLWLSIRKLDKKVCAYGFVEDIVYLDSLYRRYQLCKFILNEQPYA